MAQERDRRRMLQTARMGPVRVPWACGSAPQLVESFSDVVPTSPNQSPFCAHLFFLYFSGGGGEKHCLFFWRGAARRKLKSKSDCEMRVESKCLKAAAETAYFQVCNTQNKMEAVAVV